MMRRRRAVHVCLMLALLLATVLVPTHTVSGQPLAAPRVVVSDLFNPRGIVVDDFGNIWIAEAGSGGTETFTAPPPFGPSNRGYSGRITKASPDGTRTIITNTLPSVALGGREVSGVSGMFALTDTFYLAAGHYVTGMTPLPYEASVYEYDLMTERFNLIVNIGDFERANNPDGYALESNLTALAMLPDGHLIVVDAGGNAVYKVNPKTKQMQLLAVISGLPSPQPNPGRGNRMEIDPVPTSVVIGTDGSIYIGLLTGFPFPTGAAKILRIAPDGTVSDVVVGLTLIVAMAAGPDGNLYVVEYASGFNLQSTPPGYNPNSGRVLRILSNGTRQTVLDGLTNPFGIDFDLQGNLYIVTNTGTPPQAGAQGKVWRLDGAAPKTPAGLPRTGSGGSDGVNDRRNLEALE